MQVRDIIKEHPVFNPLSRDYTEYWREEKRKCIEGMWLDGYYIPGTLYFFANCWHIKLQRKKPNKGEYIGRPDIRKDLEYEKHLIFLEAKGFSGFSDDTKFTCDERLRKIIEIEPDYKKYKNEDRFITELYNNGILLNGLDLNKEYIAAREYLRKKLDLKGTPVFYNKTLNIIEIGCRGYGKDLEENTLVYGEDKVYKIKDVSIGDRIFGADGKLTKVISKDYYSDQLQYLVTLKDGRQIECGGGHNWTVITNLGKKITLPLKDIYKKYKRERSGNFDDYLYFIPYTKPLQYKEKKLLLEPYYLGLWLGDGNSKLPAITTADEPIKNYIYEFAEREDKRVEINVNKFKTCPTYHFREKVFTHKNTLIEKLKKYDLINNKHIPDIYFYSSIQQRMDLLKGLMDSDGYIGDKGGIEFSNTNYQLIKDTQRLCNSLGIRNKIKERTTKFTYNGIKKEGKLSYRLQIITSLPIFNLERKLKKINNNLKKYSTANREKVAIVDIKETSVKKSVCIGVDNKDKLFLAGDYIVTHNSYNSSCLIGHNFLFDGATNYDEYLTGIRNNEPISSETVVGGIDSKYIGDLLSKVKLGLNSLPGKIVYGDKVYPSPLAREYRKNFEKSGDYIESTRKVKIGNNWVETGAGSKIHHRTFADNPIAANGTRPNLLILEEVGFMHNLLDAWSHLQDCTTVDNNKMGVIYGMGTSGMMESGGSFAAMKVFQNPKLYDCLVFDNTFEHTSHKQIGYFIPATKKFSDYRDKNGVLNEELALKKVLQDREESRKKSQREYSILLQNNPLTPSEAFLIVEGNRFPIIDLKQRLGEISGDEKLLDSSIKAEFRLDENGIVQLYTSKKHVIRDFPYDNRNGTDTCIEIFELPKRDKNGKPFSNRYIAGFDPTEDDGKVDRDHSLQSGFIFDLWTDNIIAEYTGRTYINRDWYEQWRRCLMFYNATCNYEKDKKGPYQHFLVKKSLYLLAKTPRILEERGLQKIKDVGNEAYGTRGTTPVQNWGLDLIVEWLESGEDVKRVNTLRSPGLISELISYNGDINTDRVSALIYLMILREDVLRYITIGEKKSEEKPRDIWSDHYYKSIGSNRMFQPYN